MEQQSLLAAKKVLRQRRRATKPPVITIEGSTVKALAPEGHAAVMEIRELARLLGQRRMDTGAAVLPDGVKAALSKGPMTVWVHQTPPRVFQLKWIAKESPSRFGPETRYRTVRISLPYLIVLAVFAPVGPSLQLSEWNECYFRTRPLESLEDELYFPALLNCSKFDPPAGRPLSWICSQHLNRKPLNGVKDENQRLRVGLRLLLHCLLETGFNYSSEEHEASSWFTESTRIDPRLATVEAWEEATRGEPLFVLDVPWLPTGLSVKEVVQRIFGNHGCSRSEISNVSDLGRLIFNRGKPA
jgi:hypothetical protein